MPTRLIEIVERLPRARVVLVGDLMLDKYLYGDAERLSPEAPVPVLQFRREDSRPGGAGAGGGGMGGVGGRGRWRPIWRLWARRCAWFRFLGPMAMGRVCGRFWANWDAIYRALW